MYLNFLSKKKLQEEIHQQTKEYEETKRQIEEDCDTEIIDIKTKYEKRLKEQIEQNEKIAAEANNIKKRVRHDLNSPQTFLGLKLSMNKYINTL